jgi:hypothetical protein
MSFRPLIDAISDDTATVSGCGEVIFLVMQESLGDKS